MTLRYRRLPASLVLVASLAIGIFVILFRGGAFAASDAGFAKASLPELERAIASGHVSTDLWLTYGQKLLDQGQFLRSAAAYQQVLLTQPFNRTARFQGALALAQGGNRDALHAFLRNLVYSEPKLAVELFDRKELSACAADPRFDALEKEARSQAMD